MIAMLHMKSDRKMNALQRMQIETDLYTRYGMDAVLVENYFGDEIDCEKGLAWLNQRRSDICYVSTFWATTDRLFNLRINMVPVSFRLTLFAGISCQGKMHGMKKN